MEISHSNKVSYKVYKIDTKYFTTKIQKWRPIEKVIERIHMSNQILFTTIHLGIGKEDLDVQWD